MRTKAVTINCAGFLQNLMVMSLVSIFGELGVEGIRTTAIAQAVNTEPFSPSAIQISPEDLPPPYETPSASQRPTIVPIPNQPVLYAPPGFTVSVFAENLEAPRWLALTPSGDVLVTETRQQRIRLLQDRDQDGVAERMVTFADAGNGLTIPFGMAFTEGSFWLANTDEVRRYDYGVGQEQLNGAGQQWVTLPGLGYNQHWTRNVIPSPDGSQLYISVGSESNVTPEPLPRASVQVMDLEGEQAGQLRTFAYGLRNPVGLAFHPRSQELYTTVNERDGLGDDLVPDFLTRIQFGEFYGWPYSYFMPELLQPSLTQNGQSAAPDLVEQTLMPDVLFQAHSAALGLAFYDGDQFPERYQNGAFVAFRGSWNRSEGTGYEIAFVPFGEGDRPLGYYEPFVTGFLIDADRTVSWGRPVGVLQLPDGSLLFTEEANNRIYRISYEGVN